MYATVVLKSIRTFYKCGHAHYTQTTSFTDIYKFLLEAIGIS